MCVSQQKLQQVKEKQCICMSDYDGNKSDSVLHRRPQSHTICSKQSVCEKLRPHLGKHAKEGVALDPVQRHGNQYLMEYGRHKEGSHDSCISAACQGLDGNVDVADHPVVNWHVPQSPVLSYAFSIPPGLHA